jgi:hypothetical protein
MGNKVIKARVNKSVSIDYTKYVNAETGELLSSELEGGKMKITMTEEGKMIIMSSDNFIILDANTVKYLDQVLSTSEMGHIMKMTVDLKTPLNLIYNGAYPHSNKSLQDLLGYTSESTFLKLIKKLMNLGILYQIKGNISGSVRVVYMLNPFLARKRKSLDKEVFEVFRPLI